LYSVVGYCSAVGAAPQFGDRVDGGALADEALTEASGLAASRKNVGVLWIHNDSGDRNRLFAVTAQGKSLGRYYLQGAENRDWEDLAIGPGPVQGVDYLYVGDIGDNKGVYELKYIYRVPEPRVRADQSPITTTLTSVDTITVRYADGNRDAETLLLDPLTRDLYIVSKREAQVRVYRVPFPYSTTHTLTLAPVTTLTLGAERSEKSGVVGGSVSPSGRAILLKTYAAIYYWPRAPRQALWQALRQKPLTVPYVAEPQGEAVSWNAGGDGYYTVSEVKEEGMPAHLYFYLRRSRPHTPTR
jgi:hypothetical protein